MGKEGVILLHGITCNGLNMAYVEQALKKAGFVTMAPTYLSTLKPIEWIAREWLPKKIDAFIEKEGLDTLHVVAHSMGSLVLRFYLNEQIPAQMGRVVLIGPPNHGSEIVDRIGHWFLFRWIFGPAGQELGTEGLASTLGPAKLPTAVIAGTKSNPWWFGRLLPKPNDGKVATASAKLEGMADYVEYDRGHMGLLHDSRVNRSVVNFLKTGQLNRAGLG